MFSRVRVEEKPKKWEASLLLLCGFNFALLGMPESVQEALTMFLDTLISFGIYNLLCDELGIIAGVLEISPLSSARPVHVRSFCIAPQRFVANAK